MTQTLSARCFCWGVEVIGDVHFGKPSECPSIPGLSGWIQTIILSWTARWGKYQSGIYTQNVNYRRPRFQLKCSVAGVVYPEAKGLVDLRWMFHWCRAVGAVVIVVYIHFLFSSFEIPRAALPVTSSYSFEGVARRARLIFTFVSGLAFPPQCGCCGRMI